MASIRKAQVKKEVLLSIVTLGVWGLVWQYRLIRSTQALKTDETSTTDEFLCLLFFPFYSIYWWFTRARMVHTICSRNGKSTVLPTPWYLLFGIFGLNIVNAALLQADLNGIGETDLRTRIKTSPKCDPLFLVARCFVFFPVIPYAYIWLCGILFEWVLDWKGSATFVFWSMCGLCIFGIGMIAWSIARYVTFPKKEKTNPKAVKDNE